MVALRISVRAFRRAHCSHSFRSDGAAECGGRQPVAVHEIGPCERLPPVTDKTRVGHFVRLQRQHIVLDAGFGREIEAFVLGDFKADNRVSVGGAQPFAVIKMNADAAVIVGNGLAEKWAGRCQRVAVCLGQSPAGQTFAHRTFVAGMHVE